MLLFYFSDWWGVITVAPQSDATRGRESEKMVLSGDFFL